MEKKNVVFLTVLAVATLLTAVVGTTFAYFTASVSGNNTATPTVITTANNLGITYQDGDVISPTAIEPGWSQTKTISVTNNSNTNAIGYQIKWTNVENGFVDGNANGAEGATLSKDLVYTITKNGNDYITTPSTVATYPVEGEGLANISTGKAYSPSAGVAAIKGSEASTSLNAVEVPANNATDVILASNDSLGKGETDTYVITFMFLETNRDQNENTNKTFSAKFQANIIETAGVHSSNG